MPRNSSILTIQKQYPENISNNLTIDPQFKDAANGDYKLKAKSVSIDRGIALTRTASAGKGSVIKVIDALYFTNGYGLIKEDIIRIGKHVVIVLKVDYSKNLLKVNKSIAWAKGTAVRYNFTGKAPDLGANENKQ